MTKLRHELKYPLAPGADALLSGRLAVLFPRDPHAGANGSYRVCSLYFDTPSDRALREKLDGADRREKFRLRRYGGEGPIRLEKKCKTGGLVGKRSELLTREQTQKLLAGEPDFLLEGGPLMQELYAKLRSQLLAPKTIVTYDREAFCFGPGNVRITIDRNLRTGLRSVDFFREDLPAIPAGETVLEVKYDEFLPDLVRLALQPLPTQAACSKYARSRRFD